MREYKQLFCLEVVQCCLRGLNTCGLVLIIMMLYICITCSACEVQKCCMVSDCLPDACITRAQAQVWSALQDHKHIPGLHHLITTTHPVFIIRTATSCLVCCTTVQAHVWSSSLELQACVWSAVLEYKHLSGRD